MKIKKLFPLLLCFGLMFTGCKGNNNGGKNNNAPRKDTVLASFDRYEDGFQLMRILDKFGVISINDDENFSTSGKSAKIQPLGGYISSATPTCYYPFRSQRFEFDYSDISYMKSVNVDVYNAEKKDVKMTMGLVTEVKNTDLITKCNNSLNVVLKPGKNEISYRVDTSIIGILYDVTKIEGVYFSFERAGSRDIKDAPVLYMDNLRLLYKDGKGDSSAGITLDKNEILSFEKSWQKYVIAADCENAACEPELEIVKLNAVGVTANSGGLKGLKVTFPAGSLSYGSWNRLVIPETVMKNSDLPKIKEDEYADYSLCIDFYGLKGNMDIYPEFFDSGYGSCDNKWGGSVVEGNWTTLKIKLTEIDPYKVAHPGFFRLAWAEFTGEEKVILIDNIRIEKNI